MLELFSGCVTASSASRYTEHINDEEAQDAQHSSDEHPVEPSELQALRGFYVATRGRTWVRQNGWWRTANVNAPHRRLHELEGVTVGPRNRTTCIQLRDNNLKMRAASQNWRMLSSLHHLTVLDLGHNSLGGKIPVGLSLLLGLEDLDLRHNKLRGKIPAELGRLPHLKRLVLSNNHLSGYIPEEVESMATLELLDCSINELSGLLPAWACMGTVHATVDDAHPSMMYLFIMDASPKSMREVPAFTRDEEARLRAAAWIQWHLDKGGDGDVEGQSPASRTYLGDTQVQLVALPQHDCARVEFDVKVNATTSRVITLFGRGWGPVIGAVTEDAALTLLDDFPHKAIEINDVGPGTVQSLSSQPSSSEQITPREQDGEQGGVHVSVGGSSIAMPAGAVEMTENQHVAPGPDGLVAPADICGTVSRQSSFEMPAPRVSYAVRSDELFVGQWEEFVRRNDRCNNMCCYFIHNFVLVPLLLVIGSTAFFTPLWGSLFCYPLFIATYASGVFMLCVSFLLVCGIVVVGAPSVPAKLALSVSLAFACYGVYWVARNVVFMMLMLGAGSLMFIAPLTVALLLTCCGVRPASSTWATSGLLTPSVRALPTLKLAVEPTGRSSPQWV